MPVGFEEHMYVFFCQMPKTKARSGPFQKGADVRSNRRQGHGTLRPRAVRPWAHCRKAQGREALHHFETAHYCECIGHYKKRHTHAPSQALRPGLEFSEAFHESQNGHHERVKGLFTRTSNLVAQNMELHLHCRLPIPCKFINIDFNYTGSTFPDKSVFNGYLLNH